MLLPEHTTMLICQICDRNQIYSYFYLPSTWMFHFNNKSAIPK